MKNINTILILCLLPFSLMLTSCASTPYDYSELNKRKPRSILILPPLNEGTDTRGTYSYLSTVTRPVAETGYYVFPVSVVDKLLKQNGMPGPGEMHQISLQKLHEVFGADAVLYINITQYGANYSVIMSATKVTAKAKLVDAKTGAILWEGTLHANDSSSSGGQNNLAVLLLTALIKQVASDVTDAGHKVSRSANLNLMGERGLLYGPYHPKSLGPQQ